MVDVTVQFRWRCRFCGRFVADPTCVDPVGDIWEWTCSRCGDCYGGPPDIASWPACREVLRCTVCGTEVDPVSVRCTAAVADIVSDWVYDCPSCGPVDGEPSVTWEPVAG